MSSDPVKTMSVEEFRRLGYLREANRLFFHPLGIALTVAVNVETGEERFGPVWDYRDDPEGLVYGRELGDEEQELAKAIQADREKRAATRMANFGFVVQGFGQSPSKT